jgi:hypothetical protein
MAEATQYSFSLKEIAELLVRERGLTEGKWMLALEFGIGVGNFGDPQSAQAGHGLQGVRPGTLITIGGAVLTRVAHPAPPGPVPDFVVDAAELAARSKRA